MRKVLIIDDSAVMLEIERFVLEQAGFDVRAAQDLDQFEAILAGWSPDVVLTDVSMPEIGGPELCRHIKSRVATKNVPVVLFSGLADRALETLAARCGADAWLSKDHGVEQLPGQLHSLCESILW